ncbi:MAG: PKD domain-containing protein [Bacteroidetes bacterium]|nr:MAG: PKD domain-containing protein [Bacteroidota bacterium]
MEACRRLGLTGLLAGLALTLPAQVDWTVQTQSLHGSAIPARTRIAPPPNTSRAAATAILTPTYTGLPAAAQAAAQFALDVWATKLFQDFPISLDITYVALPAGELTRTSTVMVTGFANIPNAGTYYPVALANGLAGCDLRPQEADFTLEINSTIAWHTDPLTLPGAGTYDLATAVLHGIAHGLGVVATFNYDDGLPPAECLGTAGSGCYGGSAYAYETFVENQLGVALRSLTNYSAALGSDLTGDNLFWAGAQGTAAHGGTPPKLHAPLTFVEGQSVIHLDEATYPAGTPHSLLTPILQVAESIHDPGDVVLGMLADMGWALANTPIAFFSALNTWYTGEPLTFTDRSSQGINWEWDFDNDGTWESLLQHPTHTYAAPGTYTVLLRLNLNPALTFTRDIQVFDKPNIPFVLTFDTDAEGFSASSETCLQWELGTPTTALLSTLGPIGGAGQGWVTHLNGTHGANTTYYLDSPPIDFMGAVGDYFLRFSFHWAAANDAGMNVLYSLDGGTTWTVLGGLQGVDPDADVGWYNQAAIAALGGQPGWQIPVSSANVYQVSYRITALANTPQIRFRIQFGAGGSTPQEGIQLDNFEIQGQVLPAGLEVPPPPRQAEAGLVLYPNPFGDRLSLRLPAPESAGTTARLELTDLSGRRVWSTSWSHETAGEKTFFLGDLAAGSYLYRWTSGPRIVRGQLLKR